MTRIDVVIPAFNPGRYLGPAIESVRAQTHEQWHAVVVDDGSTQDLSWVDRMDPRLSRVRQSNQGLSEARNRGIAEGSAEFIAFLDADDLWKPRKLEAQLKAMTGDASVGLCSTAFEIIGADDQRISPGYQGYSESYRELLKGNGICVSTSMVRRRALQDVGVFDPRLRQTQDWDLWLRLARRYRLTRLAPELAQYRQHQSNMSGDYRRLLQEGSRILRQHEAEAKRDGRVADREAATLGRRRLRRLAGIQAFDCFRQSGRGTLGAGARDLAAALRFAPSYTLTSIAEKLSATVGARSLSKLPGG
jgi:glycosyltransferase involved in cell wall biosynthesis